MAECNDHVFFQNSFVKTFSPKSMKATMTTACLTQWRWVSSLVLANPKLIFPNGVAVRITHEHILTVSLKGELHGDLLWACAWPAESQEQREPACQGAPSDGALCWRSVQASCHFLQWYPRSDGLWKQSQVAQFSDFVLMWLSMRKGGT